MLGIAAFLYIVFITIGWILTFYTLNFYYLSYHSRRNYQHERNTSQIIKIPLDSLPYVTVQLPLYNEKYVAERLISAVCAMDYPRDKLEVQVLDDSDDDTIELIGKIVNHYKEKGFEISHVRRKNRVGFKAGALRDGMNKARGEFIAIFDADFIPPAWFLKKAIGYFSDSSIGFVQCRWGHVNEDYSTLTEAQAISLDLHFLIEQKAKSSSHLYMNFNGTAGIWRASCITDSGGWQIGTLVEDLDLSYRAQMKGWKCLFLEDVVVNAELPVQMNAAKRQQFRWAKGSVQVALKLLADVIIQRKIPIDTKIQAFIQLTRHIIHPLFLTQFLIFPILLGMDYKLYNVGWAPALGLGVYLMIGPATYLYMIRKIWKSDWKRKSKQYFFLIFFATGMSINNTVAVFDALFGRRNEFLRTPKFGIVNKGELWRNKEYVLPFTKTTLLEMFFSIYGILAIFIAMVSGNSIFVPILAIQTIGFIYIAYMSMAHTSFKKRKAASILPEGYPESSQFPVEIKEHIQTDTLNTSAFAKTMVRTAGGRVERKMSYPYQKIMLIGVLCFLGFGAAMAYYGYQTAIYPLDKAMGYLSRAESAQTPATLVNYVRPVKDLLPESGNPVWSFPTPRTDFGLIQSDLSDILTRANSLASQEPNSAAYNTGMQHIHNSLLIIETNLIEATPYMYVSFSNIVLSAVWIGVILFLFTVLRRGRSRVKGYETAQDI